MYVPHEDNTCDFNSQLIPAPVLLVGNLQLTWVPGKVPAIPAPGAVAAAAACLIQLHGEVTRNVYDIHMCRQLLPSCYFYNRFTA